MFIRTFIEADTKEETEHYLNNLFEIAKSLKIQLQVGLIEQYWKIEEYYKIELEGSHPTEEQLNTFLNRIASGWIEDSESYLATTTMEECTIYLDRYKFIHVIFED